MSLFLRIGIFLLSVFAEGNLKNRYRWFIKVIEFGAEVVVNFMESDAPKGFTCNTTQYSRRYVDMKRAAYYSAKLLNFETKIISLSLNVSLSLIEESDS